MPLKIPTSHTVKYIISKEVQVSVEDLSDDVIMKLVKPELQIALKATRKMLLQCRNHDKEISSLIGSYDAMAEVLRHNGYDVVKH